jgi:hypothetical protein
MEIIRKDYLEGFVHGVFLEMDPSSYINTEAVNCSRARYGQNNIINKTLRCGKGMEKKQNTSNFFVRSWRFLSISIMEIYLLFY